MDKLEERTVLREAVERRFHREGRITVKDLDLTIVVLAQGTRRTAGGPVYPKSKEDAAASIWFEIWAVVHLGQKISIFPGKFQRNFDFFRQIFEKRRFC